MEENGYDVSYITGVDVDAAPARPVAEPQGLHVASATTSTGRPTSAPTWKPARDAGVNLAFFSGNQVFWKTRWEPSIDGSTTAHRTLVVVQGDPRRRKDRSRPAMDGHLARPARFTHSKAGRPENALTGTIFMVNSGTSAIQVPAAEGNCDCGATLVCRRWRTSTLRCPTGRWATSGMKISTTGRARPV